MQALKLAISGAAGRMGREIIYRVFNNEDFSLVFALENVGNPFLEKDAMSFFGETSDIPIVSNPSSLINSDVDVVIDFSVPSSTLALLQVCKEKKIPVVIGTTGFSALELEIIENHSKSIPIVFAPNMSPGVNRMYSLVKEATKYFNDDYDIEIIEAHHKNKIDAPSGTALKLGSIISNELGKKSDDLFCFSRNNRSKPRTKGEIGFSVVRGGDIVGTHKVVFAGEGEVIEITHNSNSRAGYARGALMAAKFLKNYKHGLFGMDRVLDGQVN